jgi:hypothetical protein
MYEPSRALFLTAEHDDPPEFKYEIARRSRSESIEAHGNCRSVNGRIGKRNLGAWAVNAVYRFPFLSAARIASLRSFIVFAKDSLAPKRMAASLLAI